MARLQTLPEKMAALARAEALFKPLPDMGTDFQRSPARYCGCLTPPWDDCDCPAAPDPVTRSQGAAP